VTRLRYQTWDARGPAWRRRRVQAVVAAVAVGVTGLVSLTSTATPGRALEPGADLALLEQQRDAEQQQLLAAHARRVGEVRKAEQDRLAAVAASEAADLAALQQAAAARKAQRDRDRAAALADVEARTAAGLKAADDAAAQRRADVDAFFSAVLTSLGPEGRQPTRTQLDTAKRSLESRRSSELSALDSAHGAAESALKKQVEEAVAALDQQLAVAARAHSADEDALQAAASAASAQVDADLKALVARLEQDLVVLKQRHAQERLLLEDVQASQDRAAASQSSSVRSALDDRQRQERDALAAQQELERKEHDAAVSDAKAAASAAKSAISSERSAAESAVDSAYATTKRELESVRDATSSSGSQRLKDLTAADDAAHSALKATYDAAVSGISKAHAGVRSAWSSRLDRLVVEQADARKAVTERGAVESKEVVDVDAAGRKADDARLDHDRKSRVRASGAERGRVDRETKAALKAADRDLSRRQRLLASEYWTLRLRAVAFAESSSTFSSVSNAYDPATDPGSLWNVAQAIGAHDVRGTGAGIDIAHIDTGIVDVPGLAESDVEIGPDFSFDDALDDVRGRDANGHGTHLASIMVARDQAWLDGDRQRRPERFLGIAPDARLISIKAGAADGGVDVTQVIAAINWVIANKDTEGRNIRVLTLAFGTDGTQDYRVDPLTHAVERAWQAGIVVVVSGGNDGWNAARLSNPAYDPYVLAVGAAQLVDGKTYVPSDFSQTSTQGRTVDLSAPGRSIVALRSPGSYSDADNHAGRAGDRWVRGSGTSQAAAVVGGAAALLLSERPLLTPDQVKSLLMSTATRPERDDRGLAGAGYLRVDKAVGAGTPAVRQTWERSSGTGSMDGARGSVRIARDGVVLEGQSDPFGKDWSASGWSQDSWSRSDWQGVRWRSDLWDGVRWRSDGWSGVRWRDAGWEGVRWRSDGWDGVRWRSDGWDGVRWRSGQWDADAWDGVRWRGAGWRAGGWSGSGWDDGPGETATVGAEPVSPEAEQVAASE
jgi:serine protease AprX